jgi:Fe-S-cluster-containing hydrogenase component 2
MDDVYYRLAAHLEGLVMGYPFSEALLDLLAETYTTEEAAVMVGLPNDLGPLEVVEPETVAARLERPLKEVEPVLEQLAAKSLIFSGPTAQARKGYALLQVGYGMPQTFFWAGRLDERAKKMGRLVYKYFNTKITGRVYGGTPTKTYRYVPVEAGLSDRSEGPLQQVMPYARMEPIIGAATRIAVAHCPCRVAARAGGRTDCNHSLEVCLKYDDMAEFVIGQGLAREIGRDEAMHILAKSEEEGLVHMVDNTREQVRHTCNCCGHYCWNVGLLNRRRIPRDDLMAVYFLRRTEEEDCLGCGACAGICPVGAVEMVENRPKVDLEWCLGCGVCARVCPAGVIRMVRRPVPEPPLNAGELMGRIRAERQGR